MPYSHSHSSLHYAQLEDIDNQFDPNQLQIYHLVGPNVIFGNKTRENLVVIGDGKNYIKLREEKFKPNSRVIITAHGGFSEGKHVMHFEEAFGFTTYAFQNLANAAKSYPINVEVFCCHSGGAISNIVHLPKHSSIMTFVADEDKSLAKYEALLKSESRDFQNPENQFIRFASYLLTNPYMNKFAIKGYSSNHFFFSNPDSRENYTEDSIKLWQKELLKEYSEFLTSIAHDLHPANQAKINQITVLLNNEEELNNFIEKFNTKNYIAIYLIGNVQYNKLDKIKEILAKGIDVNALDNYGASALFMAMKTKNIEILKALLEHDKIEISTVNKWGDTALNIAMKEGDSEIITIIQQKFNSFVDHIVEAIKTNPDRAPDIIQTIPKNQFDSFVDHIVEAIKTNPDYAPGIIRAIPKDEFGSFVGHIVETMKTNPYYAPGIIQAIPKDEFGSFVGHIVETMKTNPYYAPGIIQAIPKDEFGSFVDVISEELNRANPNNRNLIISAIPEAMRAQFIEAEDEENHIPKNNPDSVKNLNETVSQEISSIIQKDSAVTEGNQENKSSDEMGNQLVEPTSTEKFPPVKNTNFIDSLKNALENRNKVPINNIQPSENVCSIESASQRIGDLIKGDSVNLNTWEQVKAILQDNLEHRVAIVSTVLQSIHDGSIKAKLLETGLESARSLNKNQIKFGR